MDKVLHSSGEFVDGFVPPEYVIEGIIQRGFIYSLTGNTGSGKSAVALLLAYQVGSTCPRRLMLACGFPEKKVVAEYKTLNGRELEWGRVLYCAGENPDDIRMRWIAMSEHFGFDIDEIEVHFLVGRGPISEVPELIREEVEKLDGVAMVIVDT